MAVALNLCDAKVIKSYEENIEVLKEHTQFPQAPIHQTDNIKSKVAASPSVPFLSMLMTDMHADFIPALSVDADIYLYRRWLMQLRNSTSRCRRWKNGMLLR